MVLEEENHFKNLAIEQNKKKSLELEELNANRALRTRTDPVGILQDSSLKLSACMVAVAGECQALDITLQRLTETENVQKDNAKHLVQVANNMRSIENALSVCFDDFQRLMLVYNKFLTSKLDLKDHSDKSDKSQETDDEFPESFLRVEISQNLNDDEKTDDFYAYMFDEKQAKLEQEQLEKEQREQRKEDLEILNFEKRITKGKFRPVLKQLKGRIDPIRKVMLEKEREVLAAKGINVDELFGSEDNALDDDDESAEQQPHSSKQHCDDNGSDEGSEDSADLEFERRTKKLKERDNFAEMRNFLAQKQAINLFKLDAPPSASNALGEEDILESEC